MFLDVIKIVIIDFMVLHSFFYKKVQRIYDGSHFYFYWVWNQLRDVLLEIVILKSSLLVVRHQTNLVSHHNDNQTNTPHNLDSKMAASKLD